MKHLTRKKASILSTNTSRSVRIDVFLSLAIVILKGVNYERQDLQLLDGMTSLLKDNTLDLKLIDDNECVKN